MATQHQPVLASEAIRLLQPGQNQNFIDGTVGGGGHAERILEKTGPAGKLLALDWDPRAIERSRSRLAKFGRRVQFVTAPYARLKEIVYEKKFFPFSGIILDLGFSSDQLQDPERGFSFQTNQPLDMRYSPEENALTAAQILNDRDEESIKEMLWRNAEEKYAGRIARAIVNYRQERKIENTLALVAIIVGCVPRGRGKIHPATKTFQALRIEVNNELANIKTALPDLISIMAPGSRLAVITFHSLEDRIVKQYFKRESTACLCPVEIPVCRCQHQAQIKLINKRPIVPQAEEIAQNFRSRSAKLRVVEKNII